MDLHVVLVAIAALASAGLVWLTATTATVPAVRRSVLALAAVQVGLFYVAATDLLGRPKPAAIETFESRLADAEVVAHHLRQDEAIYLWLRPGPDDEPLSYRLPWIERVAKELHEAGRQAEAEGGAVRFRMDGDDGPEGGEPAVDWSPPAAPPPKQQR